MEVEDDEKSKQLILWNVCNPFIDTPFGLEVRTFTFVGRTLHFHQRPWVEGAKSIGAVLWDAGYELARYLERHFGEGGLRGKRVLELGAGTGIVGMVASLLGADVVLTDGDEEALTNLRRNVEANHSDLRGSVTVMPLRWGEDSTAVRELGPFDFVICADLVYGSKEEAHRALLATLRELAADASLSPPARHQMAIFFAYTPREVSREAVFFHRARRYFELIKVPSSTLPPEMQAREMEIFTFLPKELNNK
ncbi:nicotinamide n-methyltransferase [Acanthamoeba castellanii str. Neff]|uniref:Nicotinamide n-methyltransferase n=1 Tax=Acanthamoeba castellanii (strain ATCC 30010 / Neff) TaxID=1257118 RepID=L8GZ08_ACACF|nr:nicotinamide n-methyltransferase [Acanthamoeba castellanii str. Neff]ELR18499.1 nicotinamide n-methyltransferase [Acanthamoeba castellanii str. Neff]